MGEGRFQNTGQPDRDWWEELWPEPGETLRRLGLSGVASLVDVGCGDGCFTVPAAELVSGEVYALDLDSELLEELEERCERCGASGSVVVLEGDARQLPELLPGRVEAVLVANIFHGIEDPVVFGEKVNEVLEPGGRMVVINWRDLPRGETTVLGEERGPPEELRMSPSETVEALRGVPLERVSGADLPPYHYGLVFEKSTGE